MREPDSPLLDSWIILVGMPRSINVQIYIRRPWTGMVLTKLNVPCLVKTQSYPVISDKLTVWMTHADLKIVARRKKEEKSKKCSREILYLFISVFRAKPEATTDQALLHGSPRWLNSFSRFSFSISRRKEGAFSHLYYTNDPACSSDSYRFISSLTARDPVTYFRFVETTPK